MDTSVFADGCCEDYTLKIIYNISWSIKWNVSYPYLISIAETQLSSVFLKRLISMEYYLLWRRLKKWSVDFHLAISVVCIVTDVKEFNDLGRSSTTIERCLRACELLSLLTGRFLQVHSLE